MGNSVKSPVYYSPDIAAAICERIAEGEPLTTICTSEEMPSRPTVYQWLIHRPEFRSAFAMARELSAYTLEEEAIEKLRQLWRSPELLTQVGVRAAEVLANQLRWSATKRNANAFGENQRASMVVPIQINTTLDLGQPGAQKASDPSSVYTVEAHIAPEPLEGVKRSPYEVALETNQPLKPPRIEKGRQTKPSYYKAGRKPGFTLTEEHKAAIAVGRAKYHERKRLEKEAKSAKKSDS